MVRSVIFDIDGTLADISHRLHHIKNGRKDWNAFFAAVSDDTPIHPVCELAQSLSNQQYRIILVSGRTDKVRDLTVRWLDEHMIPFDSLRMRAEGDYRQDYIIKSEILDALLAEGNEIAFVVDDRPSVVAMWRERGLTCLQCRDWEEPPASATRLLSVMVGPSGAGKSTWLGSGQAKEYGIDPSHIVSSDQIRADLCGDFRDQTRNDEVFAALHAVVKTRIKHGLPTVVDATNLKRKDRLGVVELAAGGPVRYIVIDRPMEEKVRDAGWRSTLPFDLLAKHQQTFGSQVREILAGDKQSNVKVIDLRRAS